MGIRCTGTEEFSASFVQKKLGNGKDERGQSLGERQRTERSLLSVEAKGTNSPIGGVMTTDPVCGMRVDEGESEFRTLFAGKKYFFCSEECRKEFEDRPEEYLEIAA